MAVEPDQIMAETLSQFFKALTNEEKRLASHLQNDRLGLAMRAALNELDLHDYLAGRKSKATENDQERSYFMRLGVARLVKIALESHDRFDAPTVTFQRHPGISVPVLRLIDTLGIVEHGRRMAQSVTAGVASISRDGDEFILKLPAKLPDHEYRERVLASAYKDHARRAMSERLRSPLGHKLGEEVSNLFDELVYPFAQHFIGYEAHPTLDDAFFGLAYHEIAISDEYDNFHYKTCFGGIPFQNWKLAAAFILSVAMRHERFAEALVKKNPNIRIEDILTVSVNTTPFVEALRDAINHFGSTFDGHNEITLSQARCIFETLSINRRNIQLLDRPGSPFPPLIQCSDEHVIRPLFGARDDLMLFVLTSIQFHFPSDYDSAQQQREHAMQLATKRILGNAMPALEFRNNIIIRRTGRKVTDLDLVVIEPPSGEILLCQFKHQDPYGSSKEGADVSIEAADGEMDCRSKSMVGKYRAAGFAFDPTALKERAAP
ncbi:hypothetical protein [Bradyrhizobium brasilense]|uniref:hypothetical protein n=1 Tax=Bradyrhizobium brasilense TaxID=1419277 RepID=UPI001E54FC09|nr:hypothetical protein [Bradyrhizobium brasilense]MCC8974206.1 hypothetical protein [Bradyrhizobium brasilense]